jgi:hypothetical protein
LDNYGTFFEEASMTNETIKKWLCKISLVFLLACATVAQAIAQDVPQGVRGGGPPNVTITQVTELSNNIERSGISGLVTYEFRQAGVAPVTRQSQVSIALGSQRQANVFVNDPPQRGGPFASRIKVTIETAFNRPVERASQTSKEGRF